MDRRRSPFRRPDPQCSKTPWACWMFIAIALWLFGFTFEALGDLQLTRFKANPENKGKVLQSGVWRYTRHPNYFGDAAQWWAFYLIAQFPLAAGGPF